MEKINLSNKRILYLGELFHYDKYIINKLRELKANVDAFEIYPSSNDLYFRFIKKLKMQNAITTYLNNFYNKMLSRNNYDYVVIKTGFQVNTKFLHKLKSANLNAKFINFHWDSIRSQYDYKHIMKFFDKIYSFDYKDCQTYKEIDYLPLFFIDQYKQYYDNINAINKHDLLFIGSWRDTERYNLVKSTKKICKEKDLNFYYYLNYPFKAQFDSLKKGIIVKEAKHRTLSHKEILELFSISNTIIDFPSSFQTGLTMRTFEALGAGKKLITINKNISSEPFYDPEYINIIDINNFNLNIDFIKNKPSSSMKDKMENYSLENYINKLFQ